MMIVIDQSARAVIIVPTRFYLDLLLQKK